MSLEQNSRLPLYYRIVQDLLEKIRSGELRPDDNLEPEVEMAKAYGVSRNTIRHAISLLVKDGYIIRIPGRGSFIVDRGNHMLRDRWVIPSIENIFEITKSTQVDFKPMELVEKPPAYVLDGLNLVNWNKVCLFRGLKYRQGKLASYLLTYVPFEIGVQLKDVEKNKKTILLNMQEQLNISITEVDQHLRVCRLDAEAARQLKANPNDVSVEIKRIYYHDDRPVELTINTYPADRFELQYRIVKGA